MPYLGPRVDAGRASSFCWSGQTGRWWRGLRMRRDRTGLVGQDAEGRRVTAFTPWSELPEYLTVEEIQTYVHMRRSAAYAFARQHGVKFGKLLRVPKAVLAPHQAEANT